MESVYCAVRTDSLYKADYVSSLKGYTRIQPQHSTRLEVTVLYSENHTKPLKTVYGWSADILNVQVGITHTHTHLYKCNQAVDSRGVVWVSGAERGMLTTGLVSGTTGNCSTTETENIRHFEYRVMGQCSMRMLSERAVVTGQWPWNLALSHQIAPQARITSFAVDYAHSEHGA